MIAIVLLALLWHSRTTLKEEAMRRTEQMLEKTAMRTTNYLNEVETVTRNMTRLVMANMYPDSLLAYTHRIVEMNPNFNGCSITTEPDFFPKLGHNFSAYTVREGNSIITEIEGAYYMMTGKSGNYLVYPDKEKLVYHTIFDGVNARLQSDIVELGNAMVNGEKGCMSVNFDGEQCLVFYHPITLTGWSIALVCPEKYL